MRIEPAFYFSLSTSIFYSIFINVGAYRIVAAMPMTAVVVTLFQS
jgi:hypothetical protein